MRYLTIAEEEKLAKSLIAGLTKTELAKYKAVLDVFAPDEPLGPPEEIEDLSGSSLPLAWPNDVHELREKFPGYQPGGSYTHNMKFGRTPDESSTVLSGWVVTLINHAKAQWSRRVTAKRTTLQFVEWLPFYLGDNYYRWKSVGMLDEAAEFLRKVYGMSETPKNGGK
jgi:hypothetical protein